MINRRNTTMFQGMDGIWYCRANVWTEKGYSSKTFLHSEATLASQWIPKDESRNPR